MENEGEDALSELKGKRIWMDRSDCKFCDENFQKDTEIKCRKLGIGVVVLNEGKRARRSRE
jgi:biotin synthase-like enzyme